MDIYIMCRKILSLFSIICLFLIVGCSSTLDRVVYRPDINQGNYLTSSEIAQLQEGMTKEQVSFLLGTPLLKDPFGDNVWFYVFRQQPGHQSVSQQTLTLTFNSSDVLSDIKNEQM